MTNYPAINLINIGILNYPVGFFKYRMLSSQISALALLYNVMLARFFASLYMRDRNIDAGTKSH